MTYYTTDAPARNLCFTPANGKKLFLNYSYLISGEFSPAAGTITLTLTFTTHIVTLKGHRLSDLFDSLALHGIRQLTALKERYAETEDETECFVTEIGV